ncbi:acyl-CoA dehydrogenase family protein [Cupriavidus taiwanensis]|uniref:Acyl-CoA dehydrogenase, C-terminal:Acyl-CoA dehydrogenase, central region:Acyl-CoA dehydrogenase, N-terminal n=3 Tax=Cupriavidus TaxID=106589 RepID=A0A375I5E3_9BURK|nr:acyl-CoA dehydrogenase family protein [Cupriavidus taiwanensis]SOZ26987.1 Acyl-CoA dehydrogenase, C-terminal:Acyl-CoA dehydrogenase, central region:Acyl-CoA dehydrogenase, N-terminal [Cupriavidus taiwanensis]SPA36637.1 Acyl-CoA dehydrogenase, C-terminal:Acyl-CoA dehydrogenase, central region:Acyl-CoA dehydrogenase, N-terminal [Cupriavidus taiwanensis]SPK69984.1 Acyl-CoA dehydrogenase, C-terminal:Acyl-CoA dehydrogenase, central region:Acyl-CoA dehydrogenase, N-terminal [Cupriavidus taiwanensis
MVDPNVDVDGLDADQRLLRDNIRRYLREHIAPRIDQAEQDKRFPHEVLTGLADFGYFGGHLPEADGGLGLDYLTWAVMMEEAGYCWLSLRILLNGLNIVSGIINAYGTEEQKERFMRPLLRNERKTFVSISEPDVGSNVAEIKTRADKRGDRYVLNGSKLWITNGLFADFGIVVARTFSDTCNGELSLFLVERDVTPYSATPVETMFTRSTGTAAFTFEDAEVPAANLLGQEGQGLRQILIGLNFGRLNVAMGAVGAAQCALDLSQDYALQRKQFGRPIGSFQLVQKHIVDMTMKTQAARSLGYRAARSMQNGTSRTECSIAKLYATEAAFEVSNLALQVHGGMGYATGYPIERIFRDTRGGMIPEGTTEIQTLIIGREILGISALT